MTQIFDAIEKQWFLYDRLRRYPETWTAYAFNHAVDGATLEMGKQIIPKVVADAEPFYWAADICDLVEAAAPSLDTWVPHPGAFITPQGFCWFERPLPLPKPDEWPARDMHGFLWGLLGDRGGVVAPIIRAPQPVYFWSGAIVMFTWESYNLLGYASSKEQGNEIIRQRVRMEFKYIAAALLFLQQQIAVRHREQLPRHALRRAEKQGHQVQNEVQVVTLRRPESSDAAREGMPVDWAWQWMVRGHWRNQVCGQGRSERRPTWIAPYLKGPEDKPLKIPASRLFAVVR